VIAVLREHVTTVTCACRESIRVIDAVGSMLRMVSDLRDVVRLSLLRFRNVAPIRDSRPYRRDDSQTGTIGSRIMPGIRYGHFGSVVESGLVRLRANRRGTCRRRSRDGK